MHIYLVFVLILESNLDQNNINFKMNDKWKGYQRAISAKRSGGAENKNTKKVSTLIAQRMHPKPVGKQQKYEPAQPRQFIDLLNILN